MKDCVIRHYGGKGGKKKGGFDLEPSKMLFFLLLFLPCEAFFVHTPNVYLKKGNIKSHHNCLHSLIFSPGFNQQGGYAQLEAVLNCGDKKNKKRRSLVVLHQFAVHLPLPHFGVVPLLSLVIHRLTPVLPRYPEQVHTGPFCHLLPLPSGVQAARIAAHEPAQLWSVTRQGSRVLRVRRLWMRRLSTMVG